jgi:hypothetical protein
VQSGVLALLLLDRRFETPDLAEAAVGDPEPVLQPEQRNQEQAD